MAAGSLLHKFARGGVVIEGSGPRLAAAAAAILVAGAALAPAQAAHADKSAAGKPTPGWELMHQAAPAKAAPIARTFGQHPYQRMIADIQAQVDAEFPGRVYIVDRTADPVAEAARISKLIGEVPNPREDVPSIARDPQAMPVKGSKREICLVVGGHPLMKVNDITGGMDGLKFEAGVVTDELMQQLVLWHEIGHCLNGDSEAKADVFGNLKMLTEFKTTKPMQFMVAVRELGEYLGVKADTHYISPALRGALAEHGNDEFMNSPHTLRELGEMADKFDAKQDPRLGGIRDALAVSRPKLGRDWFVPVKEGYVATSMTEWFQASSIVPEFDRVAELIKYLQSDPDKRIMPEAFKPSPEDSAAAVAELARAGDPLARRVAGAFGVKGISSDVPVSETETLHSHDSIPGKLIAFSRASAIVKFDSGIENFLIRDGKSKHPLMAGSARDGVTKRFSGFPSAEKAHDLPSPGPRR